MKFLTKLLVLQNFFYGQRSCFVQKKYLSFFLQNAITLMKDIRYLVIWVILKLERKLKTLLFWKHATLRTFVLRVRMKFKYVYNSWCTFCEMYFYYEDKSNHVFTINHVDVCFLLLKNLTVYSNQTSSNSGPFFINTR